MERAFIVGHGDHDNYESELYPLGDPSGFQANDHALLQQRFPGHCPHHLLHNLLNLHYSRHPMCTARPFTDAQCVHGSHARPMLSQEQKMNTAPARGSVIFLPFGLSYRSERSGWLAVGCVDCERLSDGDACGSCRRQWHNGVPYAAGLLQEEGPAADLDAWREAVNLPAGGGLEGAWDGAAEDDGWEDEEEEWDGEEEWDDEEEWDGEEGWDGEEEWDGEEDEWGEEEGGGEYGGGENDGGAGGVEDPPAASPAPSAAAPEPTPAASAPAPLEATVAATSVAAAVQAALAAVAGPQATAPSAESASDAADQHVRVLELELELARLKRQRSS